MKKLFKLFIFSILSVSFVGSAALQASELVVSLEAFKVTRGSAGAEVLVLADEAAPGALIEYRALCKNETDSAMGDVMAEIPVPAGLVWVASSDQPKAMEARLADGRSITLPALDEEGKPISPELIRALRWKIERIAAGDSVVVSLRAAVTR